MSGLPEDWDTEDIVMTVRTTRVWIHMSETTAHLLAAVLAHHMTTADAWIADRCLEDVALRPPQPREPDPTS